MKKYLLILFFLALSLPIFAQDETAVPTDEPTALATELVVATETETSFVTPTDIVATVTQSDFVTPTESPTPLPTLTSVPDFTPTPAPDGNGGGTRGAPWYEIAGLILLIIAGGGGFLAMFQRAQRNPELMVAIEKAGDGVPQEVVKPLIDGFTFAINGLKMAIEAIDKIPAASKPAALAQFTTVELRDELIKRGELTAG